MIIPSAQQNRHEYQGFKAGQINISQRERNRNLLFGRRVRFTLVVIASHVLLIALAVAWLIQMLVIAKNGAVRFVEYNQAILFAEIGLVFLISVFGIIVLYLQIRRLGEKRAGDRQDRRAS